MLFFVISVTPILKKNSSFHCTKWRRRLSFSICALAAPPSLAPRQKQGHTTRPPSPLSPRRPIVPIQKILKPVARSLTFCRPDIASAWHPVKNAPLSPENVTLGSQKKVWWICLNNPSHEWRARIFERASSLNGCPICSNRPGHVPFNQSIAFACPQVAKEFHPTKNGTLRATEVSTGSRQSLWWLCSANPAHEWKTDVYLRCLYRTGCPTCRNLKEKRGTLMLDVRPDLAAEVHPDFTDLNIQELTYGSSQTVLWQCKNDHEHVWSQKVWYRVRGHGCPFCAGKQPSRTYNLRTECPHVADEWHPTLNEGVKPEDVLPASNRKYFFLCQECNFEWKAAVNKRTRGGVGTGCPHCWGERKRLPRPPRPPRATTEEAKGVSESFISGPSWADETVVHHEILSQV
mmetsp:Transcript_5183/g.8512  ORF Transcript_5183/g.8512 Transcript_5183/m.8512 type:complete len:403 (+) Transcript_5183:168-1376(+)